MVFEKMNAILARAQQGIEFQVTGIVIADRVLKE